MNAPVKQPQTTSAPKSRPSSYRLARIRATAWTVGKIFASIIRFRMGWILPLAVLLLVVALILWVIASAGPLAPFVYPLF